MTHALIIGKFYPPHAGHHRLIRTALDECDEVTVLVMASTVESVPARDRAVWLGAEHEDAQLRVLTVPCDAPLDVTSETVWRAQVAVVVAALRVAGAPPVDVVYSGEAYGDELAARFGAKHRKVERTGSATQFRREPITHWWSLAPGTRAGLATRAIVVGAESTGTTTVSRALAEHYRGRGGVWSATEWVAEFGRDYTEIKWSAEGQLAERAGRTPPALEDIVWTVDDFDAVAAEQTRREDDAARRTSPLLVCDTDAFATAVWERRYLGDQARSGQIWTQSPALPRRDVYLVTDHEDVPWHDDGLREGNLEIRAAMTGWFVDALTRAGHSWVLLTGSLDERVDLAVRTIDQLLSTRLTLHEPLRGPGFEPPA